MSDNSQFTPGPKRTKRLRWLAAILAVALIVVGVESLVAKAGITAAITLPIGVLLLIVALRWR